MKFNYSSKRTEADVQQRQIWNQVFEDDLSTFPDSERDVLVSFRNCNGAMIGQWRVDEDGGGSWYVGDTDETFLEHGLFVDGWWEMPVKPKKGELDV